MSATNSNSNTEISIMPEAVKWATKGNKVIFGNVMDLTVDPSLNIRFRAGSEIYGVVVEKDTYDIPGMKTGIVDGNGIREPIWVSVRKDNTKIVIRGNRRTLTGQELVNDPTTPDTLRKTLTEQTPMLLFHGLTAEQERELVNDQTQKPFLRSEVVRNIFELRRNKWDFPRIAMQHWETLGKFSGNAKKVAEIRDLTDPTAKREKIKTWLRGTLDNYLIWGYDLGSFIQKCIMLSVMKTDGLLNPTSEQPYFNAEKNSQKRIAVLKKAKEMDGSKFNGQILVEGSEFKKVADSFHTEDYGTAAPRPANAGPKMMARKDLEGIKDSFQSQAVRLMIARVLGTEQPDLITRDEFAAGMETKEMLVTQFLPRLNPEVAAVLRLVFVNPDPMDFQTFLENNTVSLPEEEAAPVEEKVEETVA
jgi:hypothetical protein